MTYSGFYLKNRIFSYFACAKLALSYAKRMLSHHTMFPGQPVKGAIFPAEIWMMIWVGSASAR